MPQIFRVGQFIIYLWSNENKPLEPVHVHIAVGQASGNATKVWITSSSKALLCNNNSKETLINERFHRAKKIAGSLGYASYYLSRLFRQETGTSINAYIRKRKVERAKEYIKMSGLSTAEISVRLSFSSVSYFCSVFKEETGMTPGNYAKYIS